MGFMILLQAHHKQRKVLPHHHSAEYEKWSVGNHNESFSRVLISKSKILPRPLIYPARLHCLTRLKIEHSLFTVWNFFQSTSHFHLHWRWDKAGVAALHLLELTSTASSQPAREMTSLVSLFLWYRNWIDITLVMILVREEQHYCGSSHTSWGLANVW